MNTIFLQYLYELNRVPLFHETIEAFVVAEITRRTPELRGHVASGDQVAASRAEAEMVAVESFPRLFREWSEKYTKIQHD